jgi:hypothetical protein
MSQDFLDPPRHARRRLLVAVAVAAVLGGGVVLLISRPGTNSPPPTTAPSTAVAAVVRDDGVVSAGPDTPTEALQLTRGARTSDGVAVGYPHTTAGAVSAAVEYWTQIGSTLDPGRARTVGKRIATRSWKTAGDDLAKGPVNSRRQLGLPPQGPLPPDASISLGPVAYQLRDVQDDSVTVLLLAYLITTTPTAGTQSRIGVFPTPLRWDAGDWRLAADERPADYRSLQAPPSSTQAAGAGWLDFLP